MSTIVVLCCCFGSNFRAAIEGGCIRPDTGESIDLHATQRVLDLSCLQSVEILTPEQEEIHDRSQSPVGALAGAAIGYGLTRSFGWAAAGALIGSAAAEREIKAKPAVLGLRFGDGSTAAVAAWREEAGILRMAARGADAPNRSAVATRELTERQRETVRFWRYVWPVLFGCCAGVAAWFVFTAFPVFFPEPSATAEMTVERASPVDPTAIVSGLVYPILPYAGVFAAFMLVTQGCLTVSRRLAEERGRHTPGELRKTTSRA